jgi:hypothetical protein
MQMTGGAAAAGEELARSASRATNRGLIRLQFDSRE